MRTGSEGIRTGPGPWLLTNRLVEGRGIAHLDVGRVLSACERHHVLAGLELRDGRARRVLKDDDRARHRAARREIDLTTHVEAGHHLCRTRCRRGDGGIRREGRRDVDGSARAAVRVGQVGGRDRAGAHEPAEDAVESVVARPTVEGAFGEAPIVARRRESDVVVEPPGGVAGKDHESPLASSGRWHCQRCAGVERHRAADCRRCLVAIEAKSGKFLVHFFLSPDATHWEGRYVRSVTDYCTDYFGSLFSPAASPCTSGASIAS